MEQQTVQPTPAVENAVKELTPEEKLALAKLELGKDYTATVDVNGWRFKLAYPSTYEDQLIMVEEERQYGGIKNPSEELKMISLMWASLEVSVKEIWKVDGEQTPKRFRGSFSSVFKTMRNASKVYENIVSPLYIKYLEFRNKLDAEVDPLKNA